MVALSFLLGLRLANLFHQLFQLICCVSHRCLLALHLTTYSCDLTWIPTWNQLVALFLVEIHQVILKILNVLDLWKPLPLLLCLGLLFLYSLGLFFRSELRLSLFFCLFHLLNRFLSFNFHSCKYRSVRIVIWLFDDWCLLLFLDTLAFSLLRS